MENKDQNLQNAKEHFKKACENACEMLSNAKEHWKGKEEAKPQAKEAWNACMNEWKECAENLKKATANTWSGAKDALADGATSAQEIIGKWNQRVREHFEKLPPETKNTFKKMADNLHSAAEQLKIAAKSASYSAKDTLTYAANRAMHATEILKEKAESELKHVPQKAQWALKSAISDLNQITNDFKKASSSAISESMAKAKEKFVVAANNAKSACQKFTAQKELQDLPPKAKADFAKAINDLKSALDELHKAVSSK